MATVQVLSRSKDLPETLSIPDQANYSGGEGKGFVTLDKRYFVKIYHEVSDGKVELLKKVIALGADLGEDEHVLAWPVGIVNAHSGKPCTGVVTPYFPYTPLVQLIYSPEAARKQFEKGWSWLEYVKMARGVAAALRVIHGKGMAHADVQYNNVLADPDSGQVTLIDLDGLVVQGFLPPQVYGFRGFMAPEVVMGERQPSEVTDRHSLAVLILWTLLFRNVMQPQQCLDDKDEDNDDKLGYGQYASFSEDPSNRTNWVERLGLPLFRRGVLSYESLTPRLQTLTEQALIHGLHDDPSKRPQAVQWERALAEAYDVFTVCHNCHQSYFYPYWVEPSARRRCPFCGDPHQNPTPAVLELMEHKANSTYGRVREIVLYHGLPLFEDILISGRIPPYTRRGTKAVAQTIWDPKQGKYLLRNVDAISWQVMVNGSVKSVKRNEAIGLDQGAIIRFGDGKRLARVLE